MRSFIRHPSDIPIEVIAMGTSDPVLAKHPGMARNDTLKNISHGGLSFSTRSYLPVDARVKIRINLVTPVFEAIGSIKWCQRSGQTYEVGFEFSTQNDEFKARMVEQICHIEHYKKEVLVKEGRVLNGQEAALEWIAKFACDFPELGHDKASKG